jgi:hypothetical protein
MSNAVVCQVTTAKNAVGIINAGKLDTTLSEPNPRDGRRRYHYRSIWEAGGVGSAWWAMGATPARAIAQGLCRVKSPSFAVKIRERRRHQMPPSVRRPGKKLYAIFWVSRTSEQSTRLVEKYAEARPSSRQLGTCRDTDGRARPLE